MNTPEDTEGLMLADILDFIENGANDNDLAKMFCAIEAKRPFKDRTKAPVAKVDSNGTYFVRGVAVRFKSTVRPQYLAGISGVVTKVNRKRVVIDIDAQYRLQAGRYGTNGGKGIRCPTNILEII